MLEIRKWVCSLQAHIAFLAFSNKYAKWLAYEEVAREEQKEKDNNLRWKQKEIQLLLERNKEVQRIKKELTSNREQGRSWNPGSSLLNKCSLP